MSTLQTSLPTALTGDYTVDPTHSRIGFVARHAMVTKVRGSFNDFEAGGHLDADDPTRSTVELTIRAASIDTRNADRDAHLRSNDFFEMDRYPTITFTSSKVEVVDGETFRLTGDLTIKGVTKQLALDLEYAGSAVDPYGNTRIGFEGSTVVNRKDWGIEFNAPLETGGVLISEKVTLEFEISAIRNAD